MNESHDLFQQLVKTCRTLLKGFYIRTVMTRIMKNMQFSWIVFTLVTVILFFGCTGQQPNSKNTTNTSAGINKTAQSNLAGTKFSDWKYYQMANKIAPGTISPDVQAALNIFTVQQTQQADGTLLVVVNDNQDNSTSNFTVKSGESLYFSDGNPNDDVGTEKDSMLVDDHFVLVDANGNIVEILSTP